MITEYRYEIVCEGDATGTSHTYTLSAPLPLMVGQTIEYGPYGKQAVIKSVVHEFYPDAIFITVKV